MAAPLNTAKRTVDLAATGPRVSKIRREPPPVVKPISIEDRDDRDRRLAFIGVVLFALAILLVILGIASYQGWSPSQVTYRLKIQ